jgi:hypothetical protein
VLLVRLAALPPLHTNNGGASRKRPVTSTFFSKFGVPTKAKETYKMEKPKPFLEIKVIWKNHGMIAIQVIASNGNFCGKTEVLEFPEYLQEFSEKLKTYSKSEEHLSYKPKIENNYNRFSMKYYKSDYFGKLLMETKIVFGSFTGGKHTVELEIIFDISALELFQKELFELARNEDGTATLYGVDSLLFEKENTSP